MIRAALEAARRVIGGHYYHGQDEEADPLVIGSRICGRRQIDRTFARIERFLEKQRPRDAVSRLSAIYTVRDPSRIKLAGGGFDRVYELELEGPVTRANTGWLEELNGISLKRAAARRLAHEYAENYWSGAPYSLGMPYATWEYLATCATVLVEVRPPKQRRY